MVAPGVTDFPERRIARLVRGKMGEELFEPLNNFGDFRMGQPPTFSSIPWSTERWYLPLSPSVFHRPPHKGMGSDSSHLAELLRGLIVIRPIE